MALGDDAFPGREAFLDDDAAALALAARLAASDQPSCRWVGKDVLRDLSRPMVRARIVV